MPHINFESLSVVSADLVLGKGLENSKRKSRNMCDKFDPVNELCKLNVVQKLISTTT